LVQFLGISAERFAHWPLRTANMDPKQAKSIFLHAVEQVSSRDWPGFLDQACGDDAGLRHGVELLLAAHQENVDLADEARRACDSAVPTIDQPFAERPGMQIGPYKLLQQIGEGGMGVVYMAEQLEPVKRRVALKIIKPGMDTRQVIARFEAERQALSLMDHPNIAKVLDAGTVGERNRRLGSADGGQETADGNSSFALPPSPRDSSGRPYFVMELVRGIPITEYCDKSRLPILERLQLFVTVCQAIQHAHQKGIIHRDIKPSNVLVTQQDGQPIVKVIDFGIAKAIGQQLTEKTLFTEFAQMIGTPLYMSPEQAAMCSVDIDTRSDIYSLGVLLYELLTGSTPVSKDKLRQATFDEIRRIIREDEAQKPSVRIGASDTIPAVAAQRHVEPARLGVLVRGDLDWIVMKCLEKDRNRRYETAASLAADVRRFLNDEPVHASPPSTLYRLRKLARRHRGALISVSAVALAALLAVATLAVSTGLVWRANQELRTEVYFQRITVAHRELSTDNLDATLRALRECPEDLRGWEWYYLMRLCKVEPLVLRDSTEVHGVAFSLNGERIASAGNDGKIKIWDSRTRQIVQEFTAHDKAARSVAFHPDGRHLASTGADGWAKVWDLTTGQEVFRGPCDALRKFGAAYTVAFSPPDGQYLAAGSDGKVRVWIWMNNRPEAPDGSFSGPEHDSIPVAFSRDGRLATRGTAQQGVNLWDVKSEQLLLSLPVDRHPVTSLAFDNDGRRLASASLGRNVRLWDTRTGKLLHTLPHTGNVLGVAFSPDGKRLVSVGEDKTVRVWDAATGREVLALGGHTRRCECVAFSPNGLRLASASSDGTIRIWDATPLRGGEGQEIRTFTRHSDEIRGAAFSPDADGQTIVSVGQDTRVLVWNAQTGTVNIDFMGHKVVVFGVAWHPNCERIATAGFDGPLTTVRVWDVRDARNGRQVFTLPQPSESYALAFSPDGRYLLTGGIDGAVRVWNAETGEPVYTLGTHDLEIRSVVFSKSGEHLASASSDGSVKLWDATRLDEKQDPRHILRARVPGASVNVAFSPDGRRLATGGENNTVLIWDVQTGEKLQTLEGEHSGEVHTLAFSPDEDGRWLATAGEDSAVKVWDSHTGTLFRNFRGHTGLVSTLTFSSDGSRLVSGSRDKTVKVWDTAELATVPER
jgi:WD40 repeat protein/serine/threonine protein kinase